MQPYQHFTLEERESLAQMLREGEKNCQIARALGRSPSSVSREIKRNWSKQENRYHPWGATIKYMMRRKACIRKPRLADATAKNFVTTGLDQFWSPEIISFRWKKEHPDFPLSHVTIYRALKRGKLPGYTPKMHLRRRGRRKNSHQSNTIHPTHTIHDRPADAEKRQRLGDLEGDTVYGAIGKGCALTLVDRTTRMLYASKCESRERKQIVQAFEKALGTTHVESITLDNGAEFADFAQIEKNHKTTVYFADPHSPWQRGSNENINDLLRFFFPKGTNFHAVTDDEFDCAISLINNRPRKCLGWLSPLEFISASCCT